jgi:hypothetical protein
MIADSSNCWQRLRGYIRHAQIEKASLTNFKSLQNSPSFANFKAPTNFKNKIRHDEMLIVTMQTLNLRAVCVFLFLTNHALASIQTRAPSYFGYKRNF